MTRFIYVYHSASATQTVLSTVVAGDIVYTVTATDAESDTISFTYTSNPTGAPFNVLACTYSILYQTIYSNL